MSMDGRRWSQYNRVISHADLMDRVMEKMHVSKSVAVRINSGAAFQDARKKCIGCVYTNQCRRWLETENSKAPQCPNLDFFNQCIRSPIKKSL